MPLVTARRPAREPASGGGGAPIVVGLVNNMPDAALRTTEWQVRDLLARASGKFAVALRIFSLPEVPRSDIGQAHVSEFHEPIVALWDSNVAGLIVTGTEPKTPSFEDEPYWPSLSRLVDWAEEHTVSTIWSCLASHAAAYRLDGIEREPLGKKMFGVFDCGRATDHPLVDGAERWCVPHSRFNTVPEAALERAGYRILSRSPEAGVDMFIKERNSLFVFLQGHPEYDATALFGEYRRDVRRFLAGQIECYPELPQGYFTDAAAAELMGFRERAVQRPGSVLLEEFPAESVGRQLTAPWRDAATRLYANWLTYLRDRRTAQASEAQPPVSSALPRRRRNAAYA
jgi:homoserine O-succinyltransferase/O-acetyltransferase